MNSFTRRVSQLLEKAEQVKAGMSKYDPFVELRIFSFMEDTAAVIYYPRGLYGAKVRTDGLTICEALEKAGEYKAPISSDMLFCCEWSHAFVMRSNDFTEAQKATFKDGDMAIPGIQKLYELAEAETIIDMMAKVPQTVRFRQSSLPDAH